MSLRLTLTTAALLCGVVASGLGDVGSRVSAMPGSVTILSHEPSAMVFVGSGEFFMGMPETEEELDFFVRLCVSDFRQLASRACIQQISTLPSRGGRFVDIASFLIDRREVQLRDYRRCVSNGTCSMDPLLFGDQRYHSDDKPIVNVTWAEAATFCEWRGARLPTEAEWEKAARGPKSLRFPWGNQWSQDSANHGQLSFQQELQLLREPPDPSNRYNLFFWPFHAPDDSDGHEFVSAPGSLPWGESPYGAVDMAGNVSEWVADYFSSTGYEGLSDRNPIRDTPLNNERFRAVRGGSWMTPRILLLSYLRTGAAADERSSTRGFRCAKDRE